MPRWRETAHGAKRMMRQRLIVWLVTVS